MQYSTFQSLSFSFLNVTNAHFGLPGWLNSKESACQCRKGEFDPRVGKIPWRRKWQSTLGSLPGRSCGQRSLVGYCPWGRKELKMTDRLNNNSSNKSPFFRIVTRIKGNGRLAGASAWGSYTGRLWDRDEAQSFCQEWCGGLARSGGSHHVGLSQEVFFTLTSTYLRGRVVNWNVECSFGVRWVGFQCLSHLLDLHICSLPGSLKLFPQNCWEKSHWCMWNLTHGKDSLIMLFLPV